MKNLWQHDKLKTGMLAAWLLTVFSSFLGDAIFSVSVPAIGSVFPFRILLPITMVLYIFWAIRNRVNPWKESGKIEKLCWLLAVVMLLHSGISLLFAIDFGFSFRRLFNLCFDLCFFCLAIRLCREKKILHYTLACAGVGILILMLAGIYETFTGGIFNDAYDNLKRFEFMDGVWQFPVVTFANTNDFASSIMFVLAAILLCWGQGYLEGKKRVWVLFALLPLCFFMTLSCAARLVVICLWLLMVGLFLFFILGDRKRIYIPLAILVLFLAVVLVGQYDGSSRMNISLDNDFFQVDLETGEKILNENASGGVRVRLLQHSLECFADSWGMGVGIGNTEQLAKLKFANEENGIWSIHCFLARIIADFGIWVLIPLALIAYLLIRQAIRAIKNRTKNKASGVLGVFYLIVLLAYPILSMSSSDAQDLLAMWLYLAVMVSTAPACSKLGESSS